MVQASPTHSSVIQDNFSTDLDQLVQFYLSVVQDVRYFGCMSIVNFAGT